MEPEDFFIDEELFIEEFFDDELFIEELFIEECIAPALGFGDAPLI